MINHIKDFLLLNLDTLNTQVSSHLYLHTEYKQGLKNFHNSGCQNILVQTQPQYFRKLHQSDISKGSTHDIVESHIG